MRADKELGFLLIYENVAWYDNGVVRILDRRIYPREKSFVQCNTHYEVARAIADMVTQSAGPYTAAAMGMILAYRESLKEPNPWKYLEESAYRLSHARPTTTHRMKQVVNGCLSVIKKAIESNKNPEHELMDYNISQLEKRYNKMEEVSRYLVDLIPENGKIMTQCFGETIVGMMIRTAKNNGKSISLVCPETRPYLQGARLTASVAADMGIEVTVITDNMVAAYIKNKGIDIFTSAADSICMDGNVVNKVGTYQMAIVSHFHEVPYFVTGIPDIDHVSISDVIIEQRNPEEVLSCHGVKHVHPGTIGWYPAFDIVPPHLIKGVVTDKGVFSPYDLKRYKEFGTGDFYL
ncbi:MAG: s-methyl-5-thioribose-1-phosphate isomerase [Tissierellia bacterium]|nr:s-methyl-5-thioribose-1-phosphate isomerase [Tissierellia bacterium]